MTVGELTLLLSQWPDDARVNFGQDYLGVDSTSLYASNFRYSQRNQEKDFL